MCFARLRQVEGKNLARSLITLPFPSLPYLPFTRQPSIPLRFRGRRFFLGCRSPLPPQLTYFTFTIHSSSPSPSTSLHNLHRSTNTCCDNRVLSATFLSYTFLTSHRNSTAGPSFRSISRSENMSYYDNQQWSASGQPTWEQQTPPARSGMLIRECIWMDRSIDRICRRQLGRSTRGDRSLYDTNRGYVKTSRVADNSVDLGGAKSWLSCKVAFCEKNIDFAPASTTCASDFRNNGLTEHYRG